MYYVLQVAPGAEEKTETHIEAILPDHIYGYCFHPTRQIRKRFHGVWKDTHEKLIPGYVFVTTDDIDAVFMRLKKVPMFTNILGRDGDCFVKLADHEVEWLEKMLRLDAGRNLESHRNDSRNSRYEATLSQVGFDEGNEIKILSGPLKGMEGMVRKINLHKRTAEVEIEFMGRRTVVYLGIELLGEKQSCETVSKC